MNLHFLVVVSTVLGALSVFHGRALAFQRYHLSTFEQGTVGSAGQAGTLGAISKTAWMLLAKLER